MPIITARQGRLASAPPPGEEVALDRCHPVEEERAIEVAPPAVADFVIVHELCHLHRLDHAPEFWALVAGVLPSYQQQRTWLRQHGDTLTL